MGNGILTIPDYDSWKPRRQLYDPAFKKRYMLLDTHTTSYQGYRHNTVGINSHYYQLPEDIAGGIQ